MSDRKRLGDNDYGDLYAPVYDSLFDARDDVEKVAGVLHELAGDGDVIEFGVGTGRIGIPLGRRGHRVFGVDNSQAMLDVLRQKAGADSVVPVLGDFGTVDVGHQATLIYSVFSTLYLLGSQEAQLQVFLNAAAHLAPGGQFLVENFVHDRTRFVKNQEVIATRVGTDHATVQVATLEPNEQIITTQRMTISAEGTRLLPNRLRFIYPSELDLMARLAGLERRHRWSDWNRNPFTATSTDLIAVYAKTGRH